eukprot:11612270-Ditylum_brightwellii.AAC.1
MARTKETVRVGRYQKVDDAPKEDDDAPTGSSFDGVRHSLRLNPTMSNAAKNTNELGKGIVSGDKSDNEDYTSGYNSEESSVKDNNSNEEENNTDDSSNSKSQEEESASSSRKSREDKDEDDMTGGAGLSVLSTSESDNNCNTKQDRNGEKALFYVGGDPEKQVHNVMLGTPLSMETSETPVPVEDNNKHTTSTQNNNNGKDTNETDNCCGIYDEDI